MNKLPENNTAKPFLKWAGGKGQLISAISNALPEIFYTEEPITYIEPFIGSGAMLFWFLKSFPNITHAIINDINPDLCKAYSTIKREPKNLIDHLSVIQAKYYSLIDEDSRRNFYMEKRELFNTRNLDSLQNTSLLIFLNRTCFNGLYRVNSKGLFNVPFGKYNNPKICDAKTIVADSKMLQRVTILNADYSETLKHVNGNKTFFYFDPPYKPINKTSSFNAYAAECFNDLEQERLKYFCSEIDNLGHLWLLSNSDLKNIDENNAYFDLLYKDFKINRVLASRRINSNAAKRGEIFELLISNYSYYADRKE